MALTTIPSELSSVSGISDSSTATAITINSSQEVTFAGNITTGSNTISGVLSSVTGSLGSAATATTQAASDNTTKIATTAYVTTALANLVDSAPGTLNTLNELAAALGDDANFSTTVTNSIATKLPLAGGTITGVIQPNSANSIDLGANGSEFRTLYVDTSIITSNELTIATGTNLILDAGGDITLDAGGQQIILKDDGTTFAEIYQASNNLYIESKGSNAYTYFRGNDGGSDITALTLNMAEAGRAEFNSHALLETAGAYVQVAGSSSNYWAMGSTGGENAPGTASTTLAFHNYSGSAWSNPFSIANSGNVGIGTSSPDFKLDVLTASADGIRTTSASQTIIRLDTTNTDAAARNWQMAISSVAHGDFNLTTSTTLGGNPANATSRLYINASGNVGIGTTTPSANLTITDENAGQALIHARNYATSATGSFGNQHAFEFRAATSGSQTHGMLVALQENDINRRAFEVAGSGGIFLSATSNGRVGIGTTTPGAPLDVGGGGSGAVARFKGGNNNQVNISHAANAGWGLLLSNSDHTNTSGYHYSSSGQNNSVAVVNVNNDALHFGTNNTVRATVRHDGNFGLGLENPLYKLHLNSSSNTIAFLQAGTSASSSVRLANDSVVWQVDCRTDDHFAIYNSTNTRTNLFASRGSTCLGFGTTSPRSDIQCTSITGSGVLWGFAGGLGGSSNTFYTINSSNQGVYMNSGNTAWNAHSDERIKENITDVGAVLSTLMNMRCVKYNLISNPDDTKIGFIAQDWENNFPEVVDEQSDMVLESDGSIGMASSSESTTSVKGMAYTETIPLLLKAIQEQQALIEALQTKVAALEGE